MNNSEYKSNLNEDEAIEFKRYISIFISNWYWFAIAIFISVTLVYGINRYSQKVYSVSASLLIRNEQDVTAGSIASNVIPGGDIFRNQQNLKNEMEILKSFDLNLKVIKSLEDFQVNYVGVGRRGIVESMLYNTCVFRVDFDSVFVQPKEKKVFVTILDEEQISIRLEDEPEKETTLRFGELYDKEGFKFKIIKRSPEKSVYSKGFSNSFYFYFTNPVKLANQYRNSLTVSPKDKDASVVLLSILGFVPDQASDYLNKLMDIYIDYGLGYKKEIATKTITFINEQLEIIADSLAFAEYQLEKFRIEHKFIDFKDISATIQNRMDVSVTEMASIDLQLRYYDYLRSYLSDTNNKSDVISPSVIGVTDQELFRLINEFSSLKTEKWNLNFNIARDQPAVARIDSMINITRGALLENINNCVGALRLSRNENVQRTLNFEKEFSKLPAIERKYVAIQRQFDLNNSIYTYLLEKRAEAGIAKASTLPDNRPIDRAQLRGIVKPKQSKNYLISLVLGLLIPAAGLIFIDLFNNKIIDKKDIEKRTRVPIIGYISHNDSKNEIAVLDKPGSSLSESFRSVRTAIKYYVKENEVAVIAVSSTVSSEGKTFISLNLASILAMLGKKVLLIGLDLRKPRINKIFEFDNSPGMSTYLSGNCSYEEIIKPTQVENLFYAPSGPIPPNPAELIETDRMKQFLKNAKEEFSYIIIDTPPVAIVTDTLLLARYADMNLFIVRQRYSSCSTLEIIEQLRTQGELQNLAIIINDISLSGYYGYGMRYGYLGGYGYQYGATYYGSGYYGRYGKNGKSSTYYSEA